MSSWNDVTPNEEQIAILDKRLSGLFVTSFSFVDDHELFASLTNLLDLFRLRRVSAHYRRLTHSGAIVFISAEYELYGSDTRYRIPDDLAKERIEALVVAAYNRWKKGAEL